MDNLRIKNVVLNDNIIRPVGIKGLDVINRDIEGKNYQTLTGTKQQINEYLQDKPVLSERMRTLQNLPKYRIIDTKKVEIY